MRRTAAALALSVALTGFGATAVAEPNPPGTSLIGLEMTVRVLKAERPDPGVVRLTMALENRSADPSLNITALGNPTGEIAHCFTGVVIAEHGKQDFGLPVPDGTCTSGGSQPKRGNARTMELDLVDPGGKTIDVYFLAGRVVQDVEVSGAPSKGTQLHTYANRTADGQNRTRSGAATVNKGKGTRVDLQTDVLFDFDKATLTPKAKAAIATTVKALKEQDGRKVQVDGHTDGQGTKDRNQKLSEERAEAVAKELRSKLGSGWTVTAKGYGQDRPAVEEKGSTEEIDEARKLNRRVEVTVD